jgi:hypothetical protein
VDPHKFEGMVRKLSGSLSRRSLVGGSVGASVLTALGIGDDAALSRRYRARAEACIPSGKTCPSKKPRGKKKKELGCDKCCQGTFVIATKKKGKQVNKCSCKLVGDSCAPNIASQCCTGICGDGQCRATACTNQGANCTTGATPAPCCTGVCNAGGSNVGPITGSANECAACRTGGATCTGSGDTTCCAGRTCSATGPGGANTQCCSVLNETCTPGAAGTCCTSATTAGATCSVVAGPGFNTCCVTSGVNPTPGGGVVACTGGGTAANPACCSGACAATNVCA